MPLSDTPKPGTLLTWDNTNNKAILLAGDVATAPGTVFMYVCTMTTLDALIEKNIEYDPLFHGQSPNMSFLWKLVYEDRVLYVDEQEGMLRFSEVTVDSSQTQLPEEPPQST